jgi:LPS sulfotransferase NodH
MRKFIVLTRSRTGSNFLVSLLNSHPAIQAKGEIVQRRKNRGFIEIIDDAFTKATQEIEAVGFKIFYYHPIGENGTEIWDYLVSDKEIHVIHLLRRNTLRTVVSHKVAQETREWRHNTDRSDRLVKKKSVYFEPEELIRNAMLTKLREEQGRKLFEQHPMLEVLYEDLVGHLGPTYTSITEFLGLMRWSPSTDTVKQNPEPLDQLLENYDEIRTYCLGSPWQQMLEV